MPFGFTIFRHASTEWVQEEYNKVLAEMAEMEQRGHDLRAKALRKNHLNPLARELDRRRAA